MGRFVRVIVSKFEIGTKKSNWLEILKFGKI
jgi:hypothetical protein